MNTYIGIDIGGTNIRVAKVQENGEILQRIDMITDTTIGAENVFNEIIKSIKNIDGYQDCKGIGVGVPGPVDPIKGILKMATNLPGFENYPIIDKIKSEINLPVFLGNDANVAGLGEAVVGAGEKDDIVFYMTVSTGIGGALIINNKLITGASGNTGEVGNIVVRENAPKINDLNNGAVENEASGTAIVRIAKEEFGDKIKHAGNLFELAESGDEKAKEIVESTINKLALAMSAVAHVVDPNVFVLGGGVMKSHKYFLDSLRGKLKERLHPSMRGVRVELAKLDEPGIIGAAMLPMSNLK